MPGRLLTPVGVAGGGEGDGVYKLTFLGSSAAGHKARLGSMTTVSGSRNAFMGHRYHNVEYSNSEQQSHVKVSSSSLEAPEMEHFASISEDDELLRSSNSEFTFRGTRTSNVMTADDDSMLMEFTSRGRRTSDDDSSLMSQDFESRSSMSQDVDFARARHSTAFTTSRGRTTSDDDSSLMDFASRSSMSQDTVDFAAPPARHSTACCSDLAFRRELRKRLQLEQSSTADANVMRRDSTSTFTLGNSFRRELLEKEDRVESLALWEESTEHKRPQRASARNSSSSSSSSNLVAATSNATPHSWHAGDSAAAATAASRSSARNKNLDAILGRNKKKSSSFFKGFFSNLSFLSLRKSRKSSSR